MLICQDLTITNYSIHGIYFRIMSNHSQYYEINPSQDILYASARVHITFKLKKNLLAINPRDSFVNTFQKLESITKKHLFYVQWAVISD